MKCNKNGISTMGPITLQQNTNKITYISIDYIQLNNGQLNLSLIPFTFSTYDLFLLHNRQYEWGLKMPTTTCHTH